MKKLYISLFMACVYNMNAQTVIAQWNFDNATPATAMLPTTGSGTFVTIGGVADALTSGVMPAGNPTAVGNLSYSIKTFPVSLTASGTAGYEFDVPTGGFADPLNVTFDVRGSNTSSKWQQYEVSLDGTNWTVIGNNDGLLTSSYTTTPMIRLNLPAGSGNNDSFKFRIVSIFDPAGTDYVAVGATSTYGASGTWRIDNATFSTGLLSTTKNDITGLDVYPNPVTNGVLYINTTANLEKNVAIFDVLGKQVLSTTATNSVNVASLKSGVYILSITEAGKTATSKLVIK